MFVLHECFSVCFFFFFEWSESRKTSAKLEQNSFHLRTRTHTRTHVHAQMKMCRPWLTLTEMELGLRFFFSFWFNLILFFGLFFITSKSSEKQNVRIRENLGQINPAGLLFVFNNYLFAVNLVSSIKRNRVFFFPLSPTLDVAAGLCGWN